VPEEPEAPSTTEAVPTDSVPEEPVAEEPATVEPTDSATPTDSVEPTCTVARPSGPGATGARVRCLQRHLLYRGDSDVVVTGEWDRPTQRAVAAYQRSVGLLTRPVGANAYTLWKMGIWRDPRAPEFPCTVAQSVGPGSTGRKVRCLQSRLYDRGYTEVRITGVWDEPTQSAVKQFQRSVNLLTRPVGANRYTVWKLGIWRG